MRSHALVLVVGSIAALSSVPAQDRRKTPDRPVTPAVDLPKRPLSEVLRLGPVQAEIGKEDEEGPYMFAGVGSMALAGDGTIFVAEYTSFEIRAFDQRGSHLASFGRRGRGPGEFVQAFSLFHDGDSTLFAGQGYLGVTELTTHGSAIRYRRTFGAGTNTGSLCTLGKRLFMTIGADSGIVRELDADRREVRAFGRPFGTFDPGPATKMSNGWAPGILCDAASNAIYLWRSDLGLMRRYDGSGALLWETTLPSFTPTIFKAQGNGSAAFFALSHIHGLHVVGRSRLLVQVSDVSYDRGRTVRRGMSVQGAVDAYIWYVVDAVSGRILSRADGRAPMRSLSSTLVAESTDDPWPMARLRSAQVVAP